MIVGSVEHIMWLSLIAHGNHNNTPLINRCVLLAHEKLNALEMKIKQEIHDANPN